jgi:hypothetical protein
MGVSHPCKNHTNANNCKQEYQLYQLHQDKSIRRLPLGHTDMCIGHDSSYSDLVKDGYYVDRRSHEHGIAYELARL